MCRMLFVSLGLLALTGCGSQGKMFKGKISYKGQPVNNAVLHLYPASSTKSEDVNYPFPVTQEGTFTIANLAPGEYKVVVEPSADTRGKGPSLKGMNPEEAEKARKMLGGGADQEQPTIAFPNKYKDFAQTDLKCTIDPGKSVLNLELKD